MRNFNPIGNGVSKRRRFFLYFCDMKKLYIETYGCQMNFADSEVVVAILKDLARTLLTALNEGFFRRSDGQLVYELAKTSYGIPYLYDPNQAKMPIFASHPLWEGVAETQILADAVFEASMEQGVDWNSDNVITIDTFNLLRRTSNCYEYVQNQQNRQ